LRRLIFRAIGNYLKDDHRRRSVRSAPDGSRPVSLSAAGEATSPEASAPDSEREFFRGWATDVLNESLRRLREYCDRRGLEAHWRLFEDWIIRPQIGHTAPPPMHELGPRHGFASGQAGSAAIQELRRRWELVVREVMAETVNGQGVEDEFALLKAVLA
jgi:hypothetical protein